VATKRLGGLSGGNKSAVFSLAALLDVTEKNSSVLESRVNSAIYLYLHSAKLTFCRGKMMMSCKMS
jgi:hypothetical protein